MKKLIRILSLALVLCMLGMALIACNNTTPPEETSGNNGNNDTVDTEEADKSALAATGLSGKTFDGELFVIRYPTSTTFVPDTFKVSGLDASKDIVKKAAYDRDKVFEELTKAIISYEESATDPNRGTDITSIRVLYQGGELGEIDMITTGARTIGTMIQESMLMNLNDYDNYIHSDRYYYSTGMNEQMSIGGKLFALSGYHTTLNYRYIGTVAVNNDVLSAHFQDNNKINELYELAVNNKWTYEKMFEYGKTYGTGNVENNLELDKYTFVASKNSIQANYHAAGGTVVEKDANDLPTISINSKANIEILTKLNEILGNNSACYVAPDDSEAATFGLGNAMFGQSAMSAVSGYNDQFGIDGRLLPMPTLEEGADYVSNCDAWTTNLIGIPSTSSDADMAAYCLEIYMALSYDHVFPEFYEKLFKSRYAENEYESQIFDIITTNTYMDYVNLYQWQAKNDAIRKVIVSSSNIVASSVEEIENEVKQNIENFLKTYDFS